MARGYLEDILYVCTLYSFTKISIGSSSVQVEATSGTDTGVVGLTLHCVE